MKLRECNKESETKRNKVCMIMDQREWNLDNKTKGMILRE